MPSTVFLGGVSDGVQIDLPRTPAVVHLKRKKICDGVSSTYCEIYTRIDDPDTGEYLGGYMYVGKEET